MFKYQFFIKGLHCASCVYNTEETLKKINGVKKVLVNLVDGKVYLESTVKINKKEIKDKISFIGYKAFFEEDLLNKEKEKTIELRKLKTKVFLGLIFSLIIFLGTFPKLMDYVPYFLKNYYFQLILASIVQFYLGFDFYKKGGIFFKNLKANMDTLVVIGTTSAYFYSLIATLFSDSKLEPYFDVSVVIISFVLLGRYLEEKTKIKTNDSIKRLIELNPKKATVLIKN
ncbi:MAG: cation transporter [Patescibacteria group bacterium]|nr:cation transporter [Patescibacteria group bacterium]